MADNVSIKRTYKNHQYTYNNSGTGLSDNKPIDPYVPEEELLSEDYIQHVLTSDLVSLDAARGKIPISDPTTGRLRMSWIADQMITTTLPIASEAEAKDPNNNDSVMTPKTTHIALHDVVKDATTTRKGIVQLTDSLTQNVLDRSDLAITPLALKNYLAASGGFSHAGYNDAFGITAYASDMDVNGILSYSKTNTNATLRATDLYSDYSITPYTLYNYVSNNDLTLNTGKNIVFSSRAINGSTTAPTDIGKISVDRTNKTMTVMVNDKNITIANNGNATFPGEVTATKFNGPATKLTTASAGSASKYVYFSDGIPVASTSNIGSASQPVYVSNGTLTPATSIATIKVNNAAAADKLNVANTGDATKLTYFSNGVPVASATTVGNANTPVYLNGGTITSTGKSFANYLPLAGGTLTGKVNFPNNTLNTFGDDIDVGDGNVAGHLVIQGKNGNTGIVFRKYNDLNTTAQITFNGSSFDINRTINGTLNGHASSAGTITSTLPISKGGTGATSRTAAVRALFDEGVEGNATHLLGITSDWRKCGYVHTSSLQSILGLRSAAYTESSAYLAANGKAVSASAADKATKLASSKTITVNFEYDHERYGRYYAGKVTTDLSGNVTININGREKAGCSCDTNCSCDTYCRCDTYCSSDCGCDSTGDGGDRW